MTYEIWKPVVGYEGLYEVSNLGRVRSLERKVTRSDGRVRRFPGREKKLTLSSPTYYVVRLSRTRGVKGCEEEVVRVHRLVAEAFLPNPDNLPVVRHLNDDPTDNRVENLAWGTHKDNQQDKYLNGYTPERPAKCKRGHEFSEENTRVKPDGRRNCKACGRAYSSIRYQHGEVTEELYEEYFRGRE